jgi:hypothetical protein
MEVGGQHHAFGPLAPGKEPPVETGVEKRNYFTPPGFET